MATILRDQLLAEIAGLETKDDLDAWTCARGRWQLSWLRQMETRSDKRFHQLTPIQSTPDEGHSRI